MSLTNNKNTLSQYRVLFRVSVVVKGPGCGNDACNIINRELVVGALDKVISDLRVSGCISIRGLTSSDKRTRTGTLK